MTKSTLQIIWIGHATVLIKAGEQAFLTDPNFSNKILYFKKRLQEPGITPAGLPPLSAILISNSSYDHLDLFSMKFFNTDTPIIVPKGLEKYVQKFFTNPITEILSGGSHHVLGTKIHALPVSIQRSRLLPFRYPYSTAYLLETPQGNIYFSSREKLGEHFKDIGKKYKIDLALLPYGGNTQNAGSQGRLNAQEMIQASQDLEAAHLIPITWGTFSESQDRDSMIKQLKEAAESEGISERVHISKAGDTFELPAA